MTIERPRSASEEASVLAEIFTAEAEYLVAEGAARAAVAHALLSLAWAQFRRAGLDRAKTIDIMRCRINTLEELDAEAGVEW